MSTIPEAAIEAAARQIHRQTSLSPWESKSEIHRMGCRQDARGILEAAMPHLNPVRTVTTVEELEALPDRTVLRNRDGDLWERSRIGGVPCVWGPSGWLYLTDAIRFVAPLTVLHEPAGGDNQ